ncbi:MAG: HD domain-containing phosphohydrolase [Candidatus Omnitrophota bacterium]
MEDNLTPILTLASAIVLGLFLGWIFFAGRKKSALPESAPAPSPKEPGKKPLIKNEVTIELAPPPAKPAGHSSAILEEKIFYEEELSLLLKIGQEFSSSLKIEDILKSVVENTSRVLSVSICGILMEGNDGELKMRYAVGLRPEVFRNVSIKKGASISGRVLVTNEHILVNDLNQDLRFRNVNQEKYYGRALLSVPVAISGKVLAVLNVSSKKTEEPFTSEDIRFLKGIAAEAAIAINSATLYDELQRSYLETITALASTIDAKDPYTYRHSEHVAKFSLAIAEEMKLNQEEIENLKTASLLHDIGKIAIRDGILSKPGKLTDEEFQEIQKHSAKGEEILNVVPFLKKPAGLVRHHHEWYDGGGYPDHIRAHEIELGARIIAVADSLDAMISDRPYRKALTLEEAFAEMKRKSGSQFDPELVGVLLKLSELHPELLEKHL